jgi:hypothetical protein
MNISYEEFIKQILESEIGDWTYDDGLGLYVLKNNICISIISDRDDAEDRDFFESWVENYSDPKAYRARFFLRYNGSTIEAFYTAAVDGYRQLIPYPKNIKDLSIDNKQYIIGKILNIPYKGYDFDEYLDLAKIKIKLQ